MSAPRVLCGRLLLLSTRRIASPVRLVCAGLLGLALAGVDWVPGDSLLPDDDPITRGLARQAAWSLALIAALPALTLAIVLLLTSPRHAAFAARASSSSSLSDCHARKSRMGPIRSSRCALVPRRNASDHLAVLGRATSLTVALRAPYFSTSISLA